jgi:hypothetical protein
MLIKAWIQSISFIFAYPNGRGSDNSKVVNTVAMWTISSRESIVECILIMVK